MMGLRTGSRTNPVSGLRHRAWQWTKVIAGLFVFAGAMALLIRSGLGLGPWDAFHLGVSAWTGMSVGVAIIVVGFFILVASMFLGVRPGPATIANMFLIGAFLELVLPYVPEANRWTALPYHVAGIVLWGLATGLYIAPGLGKGPRDGLMLGLADRTGWSVGRVRTVIEFTVLAAGWALGGLVGIGTVLFAIGIGPATEWGLRLFGVVPARPNRSHPIYERLAVAATLFRRESRCAEAPDLEFPG